MSHLHGATQEREKSPTLETRIEADSRSQSLTANGLGSLFDAAIASKIVSDSDIDLVSLRGRLTVLKSWELHATKPDSRDSKFDELLEGTIKDLRQSSADLKDVEQLRDHAYLALAETLRLLVSPDENKSEAFAIFKKLPAVSAELQGYLSTPSPIPEQQILEAVYLSRLSEGYLGLIFLPDDHERIRLAFLEAMNVASRLPDTRLVVQPVGDVFYHFVLQQDSASIKRQLSEERQLRLGLQRLLPALAASKFAAPQDIASSLSLTPDREDNPHSYSKTGKQLDPKDYLGARNAVDSDLLAVRTITLVQAGEAQVALAEFLNKTWPEIQGKPFGKLPWKQLSAKIDSLDDPYSLYALGLASEYTGVSVTDVDAVHTPQLLALAKKAFETAKQQYQDQAVWRHRYPYLKDSIEYAIVRISSVNETLKLAAELRREMRITDARKLLEDALLRQPSAIQLKLALIQLQIDESQTVPTQREQLLTRALQGLIEIDQSIDSESVATKFLLADVRERLGQYALRENIETPLQLNGYSRSERIARVNELLVAFNLEQGTVPDESSKELLMPVERRRLSSQRINKLSGGEYQRVALARSIAHRPTLLFVDEPTSALNRELAYGALRQIRQLQCGPTSKGALVMITHDEELALAFSDMIIRMAPQKNRAVGEVVEILQHQPHEPMSLPESCAATIEGANETEERSEAHNLAV
ncbi:ATP-binding cassette domain-containing protein [Planctomicrobium sp. SH527]|uniref:ATP-binding cassette domain-containing protein n=1 Tax=Planctomicrobium sp. SH527 TaxID=3448123 RepID=UPI003F5C8E96